MFRNSPGHFLFRITHFFSGATYGAWVKIPGDGKWHQVICSFRGFRTTYRVDNHDHKLPFLWRHFTKKERELVNEMKRVFNGGGTYRLRNVQKDGLPGKGI